MVGCFKNNSLPQKGVLSLNGKSKNRAKLNVYSDALVVYSLKKLISTYSGYCIKVRRSSDNAELDIGFVDNNVDTLTLLTFVGASSAYIVTWYDQTINGINLTQSTAVNQPLIIASGVLPIVPSAVFDGVDDYLIQPYQNNLNFSKSENFTLSYWVRITTSDSYQFITYAQTASATGGFGVYLLNNNILIGFASSLSNSRYLLLATFNKLPNSWYNLTITKTSGYTPDTISVWVNGIKQKLSTLVNFFLSSDDFETTEPLWMGKRKYAAGAGPFSGSISNYSVYNRILSEQEIKRLYNTKKPI